MDNSPVAKSMLIDFEKWICQTCKLLLKPTNTYTIERIFSRDNNDFYCLKVDFDGKKYVARITLWDDKSVYFEAIDFDTEKNFVNEHIPFISPDELHKKTLQFIRHLVDHEK